MHRSTGLAGLALLAAALAAGGCATSSSSSTRCRARRCLRRRRRRFAFVLAVLFTVIVGWLLLSVLVRRFAFVVAVDLVEFVEGGSGPQTPIRFHRRAAGLQRQSFVIRDAVSDRRLGRAAPAGWPTPPSESTGSESGSAAPPAARRAVASLVAQGSQPGSAGSARRPQAVDRAVSKGPQARRAVSKARPDRPARRVDRLSRVAGSTGRRSTGSTGLDRTARFNRTCRLNRLAPAHRPAPRARGAWLRRRPARGTQRAAPRSPGGVDR